MTSTDTAFTERLTRPNLSAPILAAIGLGVAAVIIFAGNYHVQKGEDGGTGAAIGTSIICLVLAGFLFGYVVPRARNAERGAMILSVIAIVSIVAFWSGVTPVLTAAALALTSRGERAPATKLVVAESLALLVSLAALIVTLAQSHVF
jgi:hypothetical protein